MIFRDVAIAMGALIKRVAPLLLFACSTASAADIKVLAGSAIRSFDDLVPPPVLPIPPR